MNKQNIPPENIGTRLVVHSRECLQSTEWNVTHNLDSDRLIVCVTDSDLKDMRPRIVQKTDLDNISIHFYKPVSGIVSIFKITPILKGKRIGVQDQTNIIFTHSLNSIFLICQCYDINGYMVHPKKVEIQDHDNAYFEFYSPFNGTIDIILPYPRFTTIDQDSSNWIDKYRTKISNAHIISQLWSNLDLIVPRTFKRMGPEDGIMEKYIQAELSEDRIGYISSLIHGYRI